MQIPENYTVLYEDHQQMEGKAFEIPGGVGPSWNNTTPPVRVLARNDKFEEMRRRRGFTLHEARVLPPPPPAPAPMPMMVPPMQHNAVYAQQGGFHHGHMHHMHLPIASHF